MHVASSHPLLLLAPCPGAAPVPRGGTARLEHGDGQAQTKSVVHAPTPLPVHSRDSIVSREASNLVSARH